MMLLLSGDVSLDRRTARCTHCQSTISILPCKARELAGIFNPDGGSFFKFPDKIGQTMRGSQGNQQMNMITRSAYAVGFSSQAFDQPAHIFMHSSE